MLSKIFFPKSVTFLETKFGWRIFKLTYFVVVGVGLGAVYGLFNSWYYTNCPLEAFDKTIPWEESKLLCVKYFDWFEFFGFIVLSYFIARIIFPLVENSTLYLLGHSIDAQDKN